MKHRMLIFHDALLQKGGAEQVAKIWAAAFNQELRVLAKSCCDSSASEISGQAVIPWIRSQRALEFFYPILPFLYFFIRRQSSEIRLVSTTGVAHQIPGRWKKRILYIHSPARWIWDKESFDMNRKKIEVLLANALRPIFKIYDRSRIRSDDVLIVNSYATRQKVFDAYGRDSAVVFPPVVINSPNSKEINLSPNFSRYFLHVGRVRGYKGLDFLLEAFNSDLFKLIMVGEHTEKYNTDSILGLGFVESAELRWLYEGAEALVAVSKEDFGLTPVEASSYGCPTLAFKQLGYLDSVQEGVNGTYVKPNDLSDFHSKMLSHQKHHYSEQRMKDFARQFSVDSHLQKLRTFL